MAKPNKTRTRVIIEVWLMKNYIPPELIDEIIRRADILELVNNYLPLKKRGKNYVGLCPFHSEDTPSFTVNPAKQVFYCFGCQKGGNIINFLMDIEGLTWLEATESLAERYGVELPKMAYSKADEKKKRETDSIKEAHRLAVDYYAGKLKALSKYTEAGKYIIKRSLSQEIIDGFHLGYAPEDDWEALAKYLLSKSYAPDLLEKAGLITQSTKNGRYYDKFHGRLIFPIYDFRGQVVAFGGRIIGEGQPKYLNSNQTPIYNKSEHLYGLYFAASNIRKYDLAVIMEGYMDVLIAHQYGVDNAVAPLGTAFTSQQAGLLKRYSSNVLLAFDGDKAGSNAAVRSIDILRDQGFNVRVLPLPEGLDPDDLLRSQGKSGWDDLVNKRSSGALEYLMDITVKKYPGQSVADKGLIVKELLPAITKTKSQVERDSFISLLAEKLEVAASNIYADLRKSGLVLNVPKEINKPKVVDSIDRSKLTDIDIQVLRLMLEDEEFYQLALEELPGQFSFCGVADELVNFVKQIADEYDFEPASLLNRLSDENEGLRRFLLKLLHEDFIQETIINQAGKRRLLGEYIKTWWISHYKVRLDEIDKLLRDNTQDPQKLLIEKNEIYQIIKKLKISNDLIQ